MTLYGCIIDLRTCQLISTDMVGMLITKLFIAFGNVRVASNLVRYKTT